MKAFVTGASGFLGHAVCAELRARDHHVSALVRRTGSEPAAPPHVYGPGGWYAEEIVRRLKAPGRLVVIGSGENLWDVVRVEDVATACVDAAESAHAASLYHVVDDDEPISYFDFVALTAQALGVGPPRRIPPWLARRVTGRDPVSAVMRSARSSNALIKRELGWKPRWPTAGLGVPDAVARLG